MKIGIAGYGVVGSAMASFFARHSDHELLVFDKYRHPYNTAECRRNLNSSDLVFVCVPTPSGPDGVTCDTSAVEECLDWLLPPVCIRSTIVPGTVDRLSRETAKAIAFSPEYLGEQLGHPWHAEDACGFLIVGGPSDLCERTISAYLPCVSPHFRFYRTTARTAELCKYMENCFLAMKVAFVNQFYDVAAKLGVDFAELRQLWLADPRIGQSHSTVTEERGFRGRCLPKDVSALVAEMKELGGAPLLEAVLEYNRSVCRTSDEKHRRWPRDGRDSGSSDVIT